MTDDTETETIETLRSENESLRASILLLHRIANLVREQVDLDPTCYALLTGVTAGVGLGFDRAMLFLADPVERFILTGAAAVGPADDGEARKAWQSAGADPTDLETLFDGCSCCPENRSALDRHVRQMYVDVRRDTPLALALRRGCLVAGQGSDDLDGFLHLPTCVASPLRGRRVVHGVLYADNPYTGQPANTVQHKVISLVSDNAGRAIDSARRHEQVVHQARTDALTGLWNRGQLDRDLDAAVERSAGSGNPVSLVMIDLDDFKSINDMFGHLTGDHVLCSVSSRIRGAVRGVESAYRYGGEEFCVLLEDCDTAEAMRVADRLRAAVSEVPIPSREGRDLRVTCSMGVATVPGNARTVEGLLCAADRALLASKSLGKDRASLPPVDRHGCLV